MKLGLILLSILCVSPLGGLAQDLGSVKNVYLMSMRYGFDQYLANQLTKQTVFRVVTDPEKADALFTDEVGPRFERRLKELYPPPPAPEEETSAEEAEQTDETAATDKQDKKKEEEQKEYVPISSFSRGKGNVFLVSRESKTVLWSTFLPPKNYRSAELNKTAAKVVEDLGSSILAGK